MIKIQLRGRCKCFNNVFYWIFIGPRKEVEHQCRYFCISDKLGKNIPLFQVFGNRMVVGKVAVMDECHMHCRERMCTSRMPDAAPGRISLGCYPYMCT